MIEPIETPSAPAPQEIRVVAAGTLDRLPSGYRTQVEDAGAILLESGTDRAGADRSDPGASGRGRHARDFRRSGHDRRRARLPGAGRDPLAAP